jgi:tritrans,polycis-undecaprenyl-diphosphate synthase [geranylgeranyl-diphosphate specific]
MTEKWFKCCAGNVLPLEGGIVLPEKAEVPAHVAFIPDGNRRWAKQRGKPLLEGHRAGIDNIRSVMCWCRDAGIRTVTMWGFSLENFSRGKEEVGGLFDLFVSKFREFKSHEELHENRIGVRFFGRMGLLPRDLRARLEEIEQETEGYGDYRLNILVAYGGRAEIVDACNAAIADALSGKIGKVDEASMGGYFYLAGVPEPDLVIRTSGEMRLSGLLPWQSGYSELFFSEKLWPEFGKKDLDAALSDYARRKRRFGR